MAKFGGNCNKNLIIYNWLIQFFLLKKHRACIDTSEKGDLESGVLLGEYSHTREYKPLTKEDQLNISINVHDNGNTLEIVSVCCKLFLINHLLLQLNYYK